MLKKLWCRFAHPWDNVKWGGAGALLVWCPVCRTWRDF